MHCAYFIEKFQDLLFQEIFMFAEIYNLCKLKKAVEARLLWYKTYGGDILNFEKDEIYLFESEAKHFFEAIKGTKVGKIERHFNCNNPECNKNLKNRLVYVKKTQNLSETLQERIQTQLASKEYNCNACGCTVREGTVNLPPLLIVPGEIVGNYLPYNFQIFGTYEVALYFLTLITVFDTMKKKILCYFRLNSRQWFQYDGLNTPAVSNVFFPSIPNLQETIGFLVYISSAYTTENNFSISEEQKISQ